MHKNITIIGGGPGGYVAAIRCAQSGANVTLIEKDTLGGTCLNRGCIPAKTLLHTSEVLHTIKTAGVFGITCEDLKFDFAQAMQQKNAVVQRLVSGVTTLMKRNAVRVIKGNGSVQNPGQVIITENGESITSDAIIIATGSKPASLSFDGISKEKVLDSNSFFDLKALPDSVLIVGGGVVGLEFSQILNGMGVKVILVDILKEIIPHEDMELVNLLKSVVCDAGIEVFTGINSLRVSQKPDGMLDISFKDANGEQRKTVELIVTAAGRIPNIDTFAADKLGLCIKDRSISVDNNFQTSIPGIYAIGDVTGSYMLAHVAMQQGKQVANVIANERNYYSPRNIPRCIYTTPELASVGLTEEAAVNEGLAIKIGKFPLKSNGRALTVNGTYGMVKIIAEKNTHEILGVHILSPAASELIAEATLAIGLNATADDIAETIHAHPTLSETIMESAMSVAGKALHI